MTGKQSPIPNLNDFKPAQIVCLECNLTRLYGEVIQVIPERRMCWVRPTILAVFAEIDTLAQLYDLRQTSDLLWSLDFFRPALDTEVIPLFSRLNAPDFPPPSPQVVRQQLHAFMDRVWQADRTES
ncbi:hypothetical protein [Lusitaniella coriacea]|uniref:hypothetical protein n=1 Tax=Lusitaniella coriacea TaxID=1983105 RepID=UPI003CE966FC